MSKQPVFSVAIVSQCFSGLHGKSTSVKDGGGKGKKKFRKSVKKFLWDTNENQIS